MKFKYGANVGERIGFTNALGDDGLAIEMLDVPTSDVPSVPNMIYAGMIDDHHRFSIAVIQKGHPDDLNLAYNLYFSRVTSGITVGGIRFGLEHADEDSIELTLERIVNP